MPKSKRNKIINYAIIGLGFIADRHIQAIRNTNGVILLGCDIDETKSHKIGQAKFYKDWRKMFKDELFKKVDYVIICTPNCLHNKMALTACTLGKKVLVEKPLVIDPSHNLPTLLKYDNKINCVVQLRQNPELIEERKKIKSYENYIAEFNVSVYRDAWYFKSWKNDQKQAGGLLYNIGIHYVDLLCWFFGKPLSGHINQMTDEEMSGTIEFDNCHARWHLAINAPIDNQFRYLKINGKELNLSYNFEVLHTKVYEDMINEKGVKIKQVEPALKIIQKMYERHLHSSNS